MFRLPLSIMRMLAVFAILTLNSAIAFARDETGKIYRCTTKDAVSVLQDGTLSKSIGEVALKPFDKIVIDVSSGHVSYPSVAKRDEWLVEKTGVNDDDYVLYPKPARRFGSDVAWAVTHFIRLRAGDAQPRFILVTLSYLVSGTCELLPPLYPK
jgi:hypothetical protein